ncbi:MAG: hypothetical protein HYX85_01215 [Chloroflexi bacterium]|nr:hypothetical protein [Chloroflexota bacterium]
MNTEKITDKGSTLAIVIRGEDWEEGTNHITSDADYVRVGTFGYGKGKTFQPHIHFVTPREARRTQEIIIVRSGRIRANIFTEDRQFLKSVELKGGDAIILLSGGHGYEILEDGTRMMEVQNGPRVAAERDREMIEWKK